MKAGKMNIRECAFELAQKLGEIPSLETAILFGSAAREEMHKKSDIDILLLFDAENDPELGGEGEKVHKIAGEIEKKYKMENPFSFVFMNKKDNLDSDFIWEAAKDGIVLFSRPELILGQKENLKPNAFISYAFQDIPPKDKMYVKRKLYGYVVKSVHNGKEYLSEGKGIVSLHGKKMGRATILIEAPYVDEILELFRERNVKYKLSRVWV
ncbi:MAG: nucleotidyltransferase domain-containing protein [Methanobacteriaceae archaeon]|nr:nucleotidyltransferase domain-containing protein [Methanobacteriaceae archaeon]